MAATAFGPLILLLFPLAGSANDLLSLIDAADYFKSRQIEVKIDKLVELAGKKPEGSADRVAQLLAIRWLGEHAEETKKAKNGRDTLQQLADGKLGQDAQGFAKDYAQRALARLEGKRAAMAVVGDDSIKDVLAWLPDGVSFFYAVDVRTRLKEPMLDEDALVGLVRRMMPAREKDMIYNLADTVGNVRVERMMIGMTMPAGDKPERIYMRFSGVGDRDLLAKYLFVQAQGTARKDEKGPNGEPITFLEFGEREPAVAIVGQTDVIVAGRERPMKDSLPMVQEMLDVRAGKKGSAVKGSLAATLKEAPAGASMVLGGKMPEEFARMMRGGPLPALPKEGICSLVIDKTIDLRINGKLASAEEAKGFADAVAMLKQQGQAALEAPGLPLKPDAIAVFQKVLDSIKVETNGDKVQTTAQAPIDSAKAVIQVLERLLESSRPAPPLPDQFEERKQP